MKKGRYVALMGLLFALSAALNWLDSLFSAFLPLGMRVGLANIVIMAAVLRLGIPSALMLTALKSAFVFVTRGVSAAGMSLCGGLAAFAVTVLLLRKTKASYILTSVLAALAHSLGQLCAAGLIMGTASVFYYAPLLTVSSVIAGTVTGAALKQLTVHR